MGYAVEIASYGMIYIPSFMKIGMGVQAILRLCLRNLKGCNFGITDDRDLLCAPLKWALWHDIPVSMTISSGV
jgi:hypothetical protein